MPQINFSDSGHFTPIVMRGHHFLPFDRQLDGVRIRQLQAAMQFIEGRLIRTPCQSCEQAFRALDRHRSFREIWSDATIWISYTPSVLARGVTHPNRRDVAISLAAFSDNPSQWRAVAATLIHELAHVGGASESERSRDAENVLLQCRFADQFDESVFG